MSNFKFATSLFLGLSIILIIHLLVHSLISIPIFSHLILQSYLVNYCLVVFTYAIIMKFKEKKSQSLGFIFLGGFFLKLIVFMLFFLQTYKADNIIIPAEFIAFFLPYSLCLIFETTVIVRILNKS